MAVPDGAVSGPCSVRVRACRGGRGCHRHVTTPAPRTLAQLARGASFRLQQGWGFWEGGESPGARAEGPSLGPPLGEREQRHGEGVSGGRRRGGVDEHSDTYLTSLRGGRLVFLAADPRWLRGGFALPRPVGPHVSRAPRQLGTSLGTASTTLARRPSRQARTALRPYGVRGPPEPPGAPWRTAPRTCYRRLARHGAARSAVRGGRRNSRDRGCCRGARSATGMAAGRASRAAATAAAPLGSTRVLCSACSAGSMASGPVRGPRPPEPPRGAVRADKDPTPTPRSAVPAPPARRAGRALRRRHPLWTGRSHRACAPGALPAWRTL